MLTEKSKMLEIETYKPKVVVKRKMMKSKLAKKMEKKYIIQEEEKPECYMTLKSRSGLAIVLVPHEV